MKTNSSDILPSDILPEEWRELCHEEAVQFIACRYHCEPKDVIRQCMDRHPMDRAILPLEQNEEEIIRGLANACHLQQEAKKHPD